MTEKVVIFTGSGISEESGLKRLMDQGSMWRSYAVEDIASPMGWTRHPSAVLGFHNEHRRAVLEAKPNAAHLAIASLEARFNVVVITQNVDDLHERAGSTNVIHLQGEIMRARSSIAPALTYRLGHADVELGDVCEYGSQLRPDVVWFGEELRRVDECLGHIGTALRVMTIGASPGCGGADGLVRKAAWSAEKYLVSAEAQKVPFGFRFVRGPAAVVVPHLAACWLEDRKLV